MSRRRKKLSCAATVVVVLVSGASAWAAPGHRVEYSATVQASPPAKPRLPLPRLGRSKTPPAEKPPADETAKATIVSRADFDAELAEHFPRDANLARGGTATASSTHREMDEPFTALGGGRRHETWSLDGPTGWFEAKWPQPLAARYVLVFNRPARGNGDSWEAGSIEVNGAVVATFKAFVRGDVLVLDLGRTTEVRTIKVWIQGEHNPGISGLEVHGEPKE